MAKILLVDDAAFMRMMVKNSLTKGGFADCTFVEAQDGMEAVKKYDEENPDLVIMDITMPNMDGLQALNKRSTSRCEGSDVYGNGTGKHGCGRH